MSNPQQTSVGVTPFCFCTIVAEKALAALLAVPGQPRFSDTHPWLVARREFTAAQVAGLQVPMILAIEPDIRLSHWAFIEDMEIIALSGRRFTTAINLGPLQAVSPLFEALGSLFLKPPDEQLLREQVEGLRVHRHELTETYLRPYALCASPGFIPGLQHWRLPAL